MNFFVKVSHVPCYLLHLVCTSSTQPKIRSCGNHTTALCSQKLENSESYTRILRRKKMAIFRWKTSACHHCERKRNRALVFQQFVNKYTSWIYSRYKIAHCALQLTAPQGNVNCQWLALFIGTCVASHESGCKSNGLHECTLVIKLLLRRWTMQFGSFSYAQSTQWIPILNSMQSAPCIYST